MEVNNSSIKAKNQLLVRLCISEINAQIDRVSQHFYQELFQLDSHLKTVFSNDEAILNRTFTNMMAIFKNAKHLDSIKESIEKLGERHVLQYGIHIDYFPTLKTGLLLTLSKHLGEGFTLELETAWSDVFDDVANIMQQAMVRVTPVSRPLDKTESVVDLDAHVPHHETKSAVDLETQFTPPQSSTPPNLKTNEVSMSMIKKDTSTYSTLNLREQIYLECRAMTEYSLAIGKVVPAIAVKHIEDMEDYSTHDEKDNGIPNIRPDLDITPLLNTHDLLVRLIEPATPRTVLLLAMEQRSNSPFKFLGAVSLIRQLMVATLVSLFLFVALMASPFIDSDSLAENVLEATGIEQLARLSFYIAAAGLGAAFAALYKANSYISKGTYDPSYQSSYWIRFSLGIIAGLLLAILISEKSVQGEGVLSHGVVRPLLALLGGFSADLLYTFLNRMEETFKSLFESSSKNIIDAQSMEAKAKLAGLVVDSRMKLAQDLMQMQQQIGSTSDPEEVKQQMNELLQDLMQPNRMRE